MIGDNTSRKALKFASNLVPLIESGEKTSTFRLFDDKGLTTGDELVFKDKVTGESFALATITEVHVRTLGTLAEADWEGHERFLNEAAMYDAYRGYYGDAVGPDTEVKIIRFAVTSLLPEDDRVAPTNSSLYTRLHKVLFVSGCILLGLLLSTLVHVAIEWPLLTIVANDPSRYADVWWWHNWEQLHAIGTVVLFGLGLVGGYTLSRCN